MRTIVKNVPLSSTGKILKKMCGLRDDTHVLVSEDGSPLGDSDILTTNAIFHILGRLRGGSGDGEVTSFPSISLPIHSLSSIFQVGSNGSGPPANPR